MGTRRPSWDQVRLDACGCPGGDTQRVMTGRQEAQDKRRLCPVVCEIGAHNTVECSALLTAVKLT